MAFDRTSGGHRFNISSDVCARCGMSWKHFEDNGKPICVGQNPEPRERMTIPDDDETAS